MNKKIDKGIALSMLGIMLTGTVIVPLNAASVASEEQIAGANVVIEEYCQDIANGTTVARSVAELAGTATPTPAPTVAPTATPKPASDVDKDGHVKLNLNYSRLGISRVKTYLNVRKKPSEGSKLVGKLTKNAGCHVYSIKKGWAKIISGKVKGYVKAKYMVTDSKAEKLARKVGSECVEIKTNALRVRALPSTNAPIYSVVAKGEEFEIRKESLTIDFIKKIVKKEKISKKAIEQSGGYEKMAENLKDWICIYVDNEYAFVSNEFVSQQYTLKRAVKVGQVSANAKSGVSSSQASIVEYAKQFLGNAYVWGGTSLTHGTDCSGFTMSLYRKYGYSLPRTAAAQAGATRKVSASSAKPGDLFFYSNGSRISHVAMYIGNGMVIHASNHRDGIKISNAFYRQPAKVGRVMN